MQYSNHGSFLSIPRFLRVTSHLLQAASPTRVSLARPAIFHRLPNRLDIRTPPPPARLLVCIDINPTDPPDTRSHNLHHNADFLLRARRIDEHKLARHESAKPPPLRQRMPLPPPGLEHHLCIRRVQREMQRAVRGVGVADFSAAGASYGYGGEEAGAVLLKAAGAFDQRVCGVLGVRPHALDELAIHLLVAALRLLPLWGYALHERPFSGPRGKGL